jgi:hypothetical protein
MPVMVDGWEVEYLIRVDLTTDPDNTYDYYTREKYFIQDACLWIKPYVSGDEPPDAETEQGHLIHWVSVPIGAMDRFTVYVKKLVEVQGMEEVMGSYGKFEGGNDE